MVTVTRFRADEAPRTFADLSAADWRPESPDTVWIDLEEPSVAELKLLEDPFSFHPLAIEDCLTPEHQPKIEDFGPYIFLISRGINFNVPSEHCDTLKLAAFMGPNYLVTYHRARMRSVTTVREKHLKDTRGTAFRGVDYLLYEILDHMVEHYFPVLEEIEKEIDAIEDELFRSAGNETLGRILTAKRRVLEIKRAVAPHREVFGRIARNEFEEISPGTTVFFRDLYDSTYRLTEMADSYRDLLSGTMEAYLSVVSQRLNEVMKVLTIFATIMLPLTFVAGVYGMNFKFMPELGWRYGYFLVWGIMIAVAAGMLVFFRRKRWL
jgi:magnesium transporter